MRWHGRASASPSDSFALHARGTGPFSVLQCTLVLDTRLNVYAIYVQVPPLSLQPGRPLLLHTIDPKSPYKLLYIIKRNLNPQLLHHEDWYDLGPNCSTWKWPADAISPDPFKKWSPLRCLPNAGPTFARPDPAHTYAINGWGKDACAGTLLLLVYMQVFGTASVKANLEQAYDRFRVWCRQHGKTSSIKEFSFKSLKIDSLLGLLFVVEYTWDC